MKRALARRLIGCAGAASIAVGAAAQQSVQMPSLDTAADGAALMLPARWPAVPAATPAPKPEVESYPGAFHGFDARAPLRLRGDVPNGERPGQGVHVGGDAAAREQSRERLTRFVTERVPAAQ